MFGISYSGALSAWFRLKFPHLTCGSLSSSGVVLAVHNFTEFDQQVGILGLCFTNLCGSLFHYSHFMDLVSDEAACLNKFNSICICMQIGISAGPECKAALQEVTQLVEEGLNSNRTAVKSAFGASEVRAYNFLDNGLIIIYAKFTLFLFLSPDLGSWVGYCWF